MGQIPLIESGTATFSECGLYRYDLTRQLFPMDEVDRTILWIMLNPSTAGAEDDDPTIRLVTGFSRKYRPVFSRLVVVNLYAYCATDPRKLFAVDDPVGPENDTYIDRWLDCADFIVGAWGRGATKHATKVMMEPVQARHFQIAHRCWDRGKAINCWGTNKDGSPRHPLYVSPYAVLKPWRFEK